MNTKQQHYLSNNKLDIKTALLWACFLGSSWTWVIGMFLPVLLMRDYGLSGWIVFAIPNVIGAALMGFILPSAASSRRVVNQHKQAALLFSTVTVALQIFASIWILYLLIGSSAIIAGVVIALYIWVVAKQANSAILKTAVLLTIISIVLFIYWLLATKLGWSGLDTRTTPRLNAIDLALFAPVSFLGFILCPYLDLTFHRARQKTNSITGKVAFVIGFCIIFATMIVFALLYSNQLGKQLLTTHPGVSWLTGAAAFVIGLQLIFQAGFTAGIHLSELTGEFNNNKTIKNMWFFIIIAIALGIWAITANSEKILGLSVGEIIYRCFLIFYGLVFPAYVWLVMIPYKKKIALPRRKLVWIITTLICLPMAFLFIVISWSWWIIGMLLILIIARIYLELGSTIKLTKK